MLEAEAREAAEVERLGLWSWVFWGCDHVLELQNVVESVLGMPPATDLMWCPTHTEHYAIVATLEYLHR